MWSLNWNHVLGRHAAVNLAYSYRRSDTESELGYYYSNVIGVSVVYAW
jgi:hypothetical protein